MKYHVVILSRASQDIERNANWWAQNHSAEQAAEWRDAIYHQLRSLDTLPESYAFSSENGRFPYALREKLVGLGSHRTYRAIFTIKDSTVYVLTVRSGSQNFVTRFDIPQSFEE